MAGSGQYASAQAEDVPVDDWTAAGAQGFSHAALLYRTAEDFSSAALDFVRRGLEAGEAVLVVATGTVVALLHSRLGPQLGQVRLAGLSSVGANPGRMLGTMRVFAEEHDGAPVRCVQELYWQGRPLAELREAMRLEAIACQAMAGLPMSLLCAYDAALDPDLLARAKRAHPMVGLDGCWRRGEPVAGAPGWAGNEEPLPGPPAGAAELLFRSEQASVRRFVAAQAGRAGLRPNRIGDLVLAAGELAANTLAHTEGPGTLTMWVADGSVICQVSDTGLIADPLPGTLRADPASAVRHQGLWLVQQVGDLVQIRSGQEGTIIRVHMRL